MVPFPPELVGRVNYAFLAWYNEACIGEITLRFLEGDPAFFHDNTFVGYLRLFTFARTDSFEPTHFGHEHDKARELLLYFGEREVKIPLDRKPRAASQLTFSGFRSLP
jgi:hypothetical protein